MRKTVGYNPYTLGEKKKSYTRLMWFVAVGVPLFASLVFFPISLMLEANGASSVFKYIVYYLSELLSVGALFATLSLGVVAVSHEERALRRKTLLLQCAGYLVFAFLLRVFLYWLTAYLDSVLLWDFYFNDKTLAHLVKGGALLAYLFSSFLNLILLLAVLFLSFAIVRALYRKSPSRGKASPWMTRVPVLVYLGVSLVFAVIESVLTVGELGFAFTPNVFITLLLPYFEMALFSLLGYYLLCYLVESFEKTDT